MNRNWQMCVVDSDLIDGKDMPKFSKIIASELNADNELGNGDVVFVAFTEMRPISKFSNDLQDELQRHPTFRFFEDVQFAYVWYPKTKRYIWILQSILRPILCEEDAIEVETKFGINLEKWA